MAFPHDVLLWLLLLTNNILSTASPSTTSKPGCQSKCGDLIVPYPFGIGVDGRCSLGHWYNVNCSNSTDPPTPFLARTNLETMEISEKHVKINTHVAKNCNNSIGDDFSSPMGLITSPYSFSDTNVFTVVGCDEVGVMTETHGRNFSIGCLSLCSNRDDLIPGLIPGSCSGIGCCQTQIPKGLKTFEVELFSLNDHNYSRSFDNCGYAFVVEKDKFTFRGADDLADSQFQRKTVGSVPIVLDWHVGNDTRCVEAQRATYLCQGNTSCFDSDIGYAGYRCHCLPGYEGNPYLSPGCTDVDECASETNPCTHTCTNFPGGYKCSCPKWHQGDGLKRGNGCVPSKAEFAMKIGLGTSSVLLATFFCISILYFIKRKRQILKMREIFFQQNGGYLLRKQISSNNEGRIIGKGGCGTIYKGVLSNNVVVAIKKSKAAIESQVQQFINEVCSKWNSF